MAIKEVLEKIKQQIDDAFLTNDIFFRYVMQNKEACQLVIRVITDRRDLVVKEVTTQSELNNLFNRSAVLDVLCEDSEGRKINIEMQTCDNDDHPRRVRYTVALLDGKFTPKGSKFKDMSDIIIIYITTFDFLGLGETIYPIKPAIVGKNKFIDNGIDVFFINTAVNDGSEKAALMQYMLTGEGGERFPALSNFVNYVKNNSEGKTMFNDYATDYVAQYGDEREALGRAEGEMRGEARGKAEGALQTCSKMVQKYASKNGISVDEAMDSLSVDEDQRPLVKKMLSL